MGARLVNAQHRNFRLDSWKEKKRSLKKYLIHTAVRWKLLQTQWTTIGKCSTNSSLTHVVKGGETLTSISRKYGVSILEIAAENGNMVDIDFVLEGERLNIPVRSKKLQMRVGILFLVIILRKPERTESNPEVMDSKELYDPKLNRWNSLSHIQWTHGTEKVLCKLSSYRSQIANPTGYLHVLGPIIALCFIFTIKALQAIMKTKRQEPNKLQAPHSGLRTDRWRTILDDHTESDTLDTSSGEDLGDPSDEDHSPTCSKEMSHEYSKIESAYLKFLSECGMSKWGYFHGGSPE